MATVYYGRALYYPYINLIDTKWIKTAALYYEGLNRIVPYGYETNDSDIIRRLNEKEKFIRDESPHSNLDKVADDFLDYAKINLFNSKARKALIARIGVVIPKNASFSINEHKMAHKLKEKLQEVGLAKPLKINNHSMFEFEPVTGSIYMTYLAHSMAQSSKMPIVTDNAIFQPFIREIQTKEESDLTDNGHALASMVIESVVPYDIENIPIEKIIKFRKNCISERILFYEEINKVVEDIKAVEDERSLKNILEYKKRRIQIAVQNLKRAYKNIGIATVPSLFGLALPPFLSNLPSSFVIGTFGAVATVALGQKFFEYKKEKLTNPYSYVLSLQNNLKSETLASQLIKGKIIF